MKTRWIVIVSFFLFGAASYAQLSTEQTKDIDNLFVEWNKKDHPGGAVGIMHKGQMVYSKAFGLASLEYGIANQPETIFNTGSVSKQFTAMGIVRLHEQGLLSVDDDIRKHLPDLPDFGHTITIRHMLHHTSGMRSLHAMLSLAGWRGDDSRTNEDLYRFMLRQKELNFKPGDEYLYCNTGYMLMVNIIEKVTNDKFPAWMKDNIFTPLGLTNTYVEDRYDRVIPMNATSYFWDKDAYYRAVEYWGYVGSGNMHSTTSDLLHWLQNFSDPTEGWETSFELLKTVDPLNDGSENNYAFGISVDQFMGHERIGHGGSIGGFRSSVRTFPEEELSIAILTNYSGSNPGQKEVQIAELLLENKVTSNDSSPSSITSVESVDLSSAQLKNFEGSYWNDTENFARKIYVKNDTLRYYRSANSENALMPISSNEFQMLGISAKLIAKFEKDPSGKKTMIVIVDDGSPSLFTEYQPVSDISQLGKEYEGRYFSPELETIVHIQLRGDRLMGYQARHGEFPFKILKKDVLEIPGFATLKVTRNADDVVTGVRISNGRARNVWFEKMK